MTPEGEMRKSPHSPSREWRTGRLKKCPMTNCVDGAARIYDGDQTPLRPRRRIRGYSSHAASLKAVGKVRHEQGKERRRKT